MGLRVTCFHWSRDLSSSAQHGPGGASFTPGALASPPSAGGLAHHRTCLRGSPLGYPSARRIHRAPRYLWSTVPESQSFRAAAAVTGTGVLGKRPRGEPDPSSYAAWMRPSRQRPAPWPDRQVPALEPAVEPAQSQGPPSDTVDAAAPAAGQAAPWAHVWRVIYTSHHDRRQRTTAWQLLHGKLFVCAFSQRIRRADPAGHSCPHSGCESQPATLTHVFITCPLAAGVWDWHAATWAAVTGETAPPRSTDLLLANDTRVWEPPRQLRPL
ncbi:hypothetical protein COCSUDRAFT_58048 [Coccomyxa subellipsoidea C-169]|uniref:Reverse transcriptase zinc-binding domain-containing protein n=1 Tax=Coccomyxa subellipsoidea (strain C-169) TaxID=574566 RepID=I0YPM2_COCSC|nr:hypothetical protein COCSUDRAFT_58048 [Coccomyxa subellipsoidea C-169]EIE20341.1 hypothetical protein COCSUDRAFT_58048 [Coccomyxa subellipsoidea C-169]|eukprot:XP_005644885.1 hypothetical protein COCSUDRAFT_58048 [Coccomyxa subellipsoidea C-169]